MFVGRPGHTVPRVSLLVAVRRRDDRPAEPSSPRLGSPRRVRRPTGRPTDRRLKIDADTSLLVRRGALLDTTAPPSSSAAINESLQYRHVMRDERRPLCHFSYRSHSRSIVRSYGRQTMTPPWDCDNDRQPKMALSVQPLCAPILPFQIVRRCRNLIGLWHDIV